MGDEALNKIKYAIIKGEIKKGDYKMFKIDIDLSQKSLFKDLRIQTKNILEKLKNVEFKNENDGVIARITRNSIDKMMSVEAVNKSLKNGYKKEEHFASVKNIDKLFKQAHFINSEKSKKKSADVVAYHKYKVSFMINDKPADAKITLKESIEAGHRIYSLELLEIG